MHKKCVSEHPEAIKINVQIFLAAILFFPKCREICTEAIENAVTITFSAGGAPKTTGFFAVICILQFSLISEHFNTF